MFSGRDFRQNSTDLFDEIVFDPKPRGAVPAPQTASLSRTAASHSSSPMRRSARLSHCHPDRAADE
ncbi:MAG: hypothetical protein JWM91_320 [Rhodospirillales bacterium]|nr:hypothetical protein [Rhodospirillales bacterium]